MNFRMRCCCRRKPFEEINVRFEDLTHMITSAVQVSDDDDHLGTTMPKLKVAITDKINRIAEESNISEFCYQNSEYNLETKL